MTIILSNSMKNTIILLISCLFSIYFLSCSSNTEDLNQYKVGEFEFLIDSIYNVTQTSVTIKATLRTPAVEKNIIGLQINYVKESVLYKDYSTKTVSFEKKAGTVVMTLNNLEPNTIYRVTPTIEVAHGTNPKIAYLVGMSTTNSELSFMTHGELPKTGTVNDIDGNLYHYITIGTQTWMVENLKTTHFRTGESIPYLKDSVSWVKSEYGYCDYNNDIKYATKYGHIYAKEIANSFVAPGGWHVPTLSDWKTLESYLIANGYNYDKSKKYNKIAKSLASQTSDWQSEPYTGGITEDLTLNNSTGFTALPGGSRTIYSNYINAGNGCYLWSSAPNNKINYGFSLEANSISSSLYEPNYFSGMYIRCIRDN